MTGTGNEGAAAVKIATAAGWSIADTTPAHANKSYGVLRLRRQALSEGPLMLIRGVLMLGRATSSSSFAGPWRFR